MKTFYYEATVGQQNFCFEMTAEIQEIASYRNFILENI